MFDLFKKKPLQQDNAYLMHKRSEAKTATFKHVPDYNNLLRGLSEEEYKKSLSFWGRHKFKKDQKRLAQKQERAAWRSIVREKGMDERAERMAQTIGFEDDEKSEEFKTEFMMGEVLRRMGKRPEDLGYFERRRMRRKIEDARRRNARHDLKEAYRNTNFVKRITENDGKEYDEETRTYKDKTAGENSKASMSRDENNAALAGTIIGIVGTVGITGADFGTGMDHTGMPATIMNTLSSGLSQDVQAFSEGLGGEIGRGAGGVLGVAGSATSAVAAAARAVESGQAGDSYTAWQQGLDSLSNAVSAGAAVAKAFGKANLVAVDAAYGLGVISGVAKALSGAVGLGNALGDISNIADEMEKYQKGYDSDKEEDVENYELYSLSRKAAKRRAVAAGFDAVTGTLDAVASAVSLAGGATISTALTVISVGVKVAKFVTGKVQEASHLNSTLRAVRHSKDVAEKTKAVKGIGLLDKKKQEEILGKTAGAAGRSELQDKMAVRQAIRLHAMISPEKPQKPEVVRTLSTLGFTDQEKYPQITVQQLAEKIGFSGKKWRDAMHDEKADERRNKEEARTDRIAERAAALRKSKRLDKLALGQQATRGTDPDWAKQLPSIALAAAQQGQIRASKRQAAAAQP